MAVQFKVEEHKQQCIETETDNLYIYLYIDLRPNYLRYKIHKRWLLSWIHFMVIIRVVTILNALKCRWPLAWHQYRSAIKKELLHLPKIDFSEEKCHGKCLEEHFSKFSGGMCSVLETCLVLF